MPDHVQTEGTMLNMTLTQTLGAATFRSEATNWKIQIEFDVGFRCTYREGVQSH